LRWTFRLSDAICIDREGFCDILREIRRRLSRESYRGVEVLYAERIRTALELILEEHCEEDIRNCTASLIPLLSQPVGNVQFALYCGKH